MTPVLYSIHVYVMGIGDVLVRRIEHYDDDIMLMGETADEPSMWRDSMHMLGKENHGSWNDRYTI